MGRQAQAKLKHRRAEQKRSKLRARALTVLDDTFAEASARVAAIYQNATPAGREALDSRFAEWAEAYDANPVGAAEAARMAQRIVALPVSRGGTAGAAAAKGDYPRLRAKVIAALETLHGSALSACLHLAPNSPAAAVCIDEPCVALCTDCMDTHLRSDHPPSWNHQCLDCGSVDMRGISPVMIPPMLGMPIRFGDQEQLFIGPVVMTGLGICNPCRLSTGKRRSRQATGSRSGRA